MVIAGKNDVRIAEVVTEVDAFLRTPKSVELTTAFDDDGFQLKIFYLAG